MLFSRVKILCYCSKALLVFHWYSYNKGYYYILSAYVWVHARLGRRWQWIISGWNHDTRLSVCHVHTLSPTHSALLPDSTCYRVIERFHSRDQYLCKFMRAKESVYIRKARVQLLRQNLFGTPIWPPINCFWDTDMAAVTSCENALVTPQQLKGKE